MRHFVDDFKKELASESAPGIASLYGSAQRIRL